MLPQNYVDHFLLGIVVHELLVKSHAAFESVIQQPFNVSSSGSRDVGVSGASACVVLRYHVSVVCPCVFEMDDKNRGVLDVVGC